MFTGKNNSHVITCNAVVVWDGITKPEEKDDGSLTHNLRVAIPNNAPELAELRALSKAALDASKWKGKMPAGGGDGLMEADVEKFGEALANHTCFTAGTRRGVPYVSDIDARELNSMQFKRSFYPGAIVKLLVHAYDYDNKQKGIAFGLDGIQIIDTTAPALAVGGGINPSEVAAAFASASGGAAPAAAGGYVMTDTAEYTRAEYLEAGWTDQDIIDAGHMTVSKPAAPARPAPPAKPAAPAPKPKAPAPKPSAPAPRPTAPHSTILAGGPKMTEAAEYTYAEYIDAGHTDESLIADGLMEPKRAAAPAPKPKPAAPAPKPKPVVIAGAPGYVMTEHASNSYAEYIDAGWDDEGLIASDFMREAA